MADGEQIHASQFPGSLVGPIFHDQIEAAIRHHAAESACFVVNATGWLTDEQRPPSTPQAPTTRRWRAAATPPSSRPKASMWFRR
jgi:hypothetical protein